MKNSNISWTKSTWNPWIGCRKVSKACKFCYMHRILEKGGSNPNTVVKSIGSFNAPLKWEKGRKIFTCSMSDFFIEEADKWREEIWEIIKQTRQHTYLILTKRPERIKDNLPNDWNSENYPHVWIGVTVEDQESVSRIHYLDEFGCNVKWVSFEPLLGEVYLTGKELSIIDWAVIGGESGNKKGKYQFRKSELSWFLSLMYQFEKEDTPYFFKQFGTWYHYNQFKLKDWKGEKQCENFPKSFETRQYPKIYNYGKTINQ
ncbi:MAG: DUF5131 family protein [Xanthomarina gelatinilytica]|uniref:DUF5131 family protein n=1 Tax=Xanthomarina gelatinilytica TaxID=1137281 RepID=UPI003A835C4F